MNRRRWSPFARARARHARPGLEVLEDRSLPSVSVLTAHNDASRDGLNAAETTLTPANVNSSQFGKLFSVPVDGQVYAQPLYVAGLAVPNQGTHDVVFVATEHDSVYAFDAESGALLWHDSFINPSAGITTVSSSDVNCNQITPEIGITATPVIDLGSGTLYVESETKVVSGGTTTFVQALHALNVGTGAEKFNGPVTIQASVPGNGDGGSTVSLIPKDYKARAGLLLLNGVVYVGFASNCDITPAHGWVVGYNATTLAQVSVLCSSPNTQLDTIWMSNGGLASDGSDVYAVTGNGPVSGSSNGFNPSQGDYAETVLKLSTGSGLSVADYFTPYNWQTLDANDEDFGSGGLALFQQPGAAAPDLLVTAGKQGTVYLINRDNLGQFHSGGDSVVQELPGAIGSSFGSPAYFNNTVYYGGVSDTLKAFTLTNGLFASSPTSHSSESYGYPGTTPSVSANGTSNGIVWAIQNSSHAILRAYSAANLADELYNSDQAGSRDQLDAAVKFTTPTVADGKVFVGTNGQLTVFGLLQSFKVVSAVPQGSGGSVSAVTLTFNQPVLAGSFTTSSVDSLAGPSGSITPSNVNEISPTQYQVTFPAQSAPGTYSLTVGPAIKNGNGTAMDQNGNGVAGEVPADEYTTTFGLPLPVTLPYSETFGDGVAHGFASQAGSWSVSGGTYDASPAFALGDEASVLQVSGALPSALQFGATMSATAVSGSLYSNGFLIFDYQSATNFKFAGAYVGNQQWVVGHRDANGWEIDAALSDPSIRPGTAYALQLWLQGRNADLYVNGAGKVNFNYGSAFTGSVGLGAENSLTQFTNLSAQQPAAGTLPITENFSDGQAHDFVPQEGSWAVSNSRYDATPINGGDALTDLLTNGALPSSLEFDVTMNAAAPSGSFYSNGFIIFNYQSPTSFDYAGAFVGLQEWVIGHRDTSGWHNDAVTNDAGIAPGTDYGLQLLLQGTSASLLANGTSKVGFTFSSGFTGTLGLGTWNSLTQFTNLTVKQGS